MQGNTALDTGRNSVVKFDGNELYEQDQEQAEKTLEKVLEELNKDSE